MASSKAVSKPKKTDVADMNAMFAGMAGMGMENVTSDDILIPRLTILQDLSPQVKPRKSEYIEGAKPGDICDVGTGELFAAPVEFLPVYYKKVWIEWAPRDSGKGLVAIHETDAALDGCSPNDRGQMVNEHGNYIAETAQFFGFNLSAPDCRKCFIPFVSTQLKKARKLNTLAMSEKVEGPDGEMFTPPLFYRAYNLGTAEEDNAQGEWSGWTIERGRRLEEMDRAASLFEEAKKFHEQLVEGRAKADTSDIEENQKASDDNAAM